MRGFLSPYLLLALLGLLFFADLVVHPGQVLYSDYSDLLAFHLPDKHFLVRSWHETGDLPLWCPDRFAGMPFLHDTQVAAFYPLHWPLLLLPEDTLGAALSWLVVLHVIVAGWCMYAYARYQGLDTPAALIAAIGYMFAGKWLLTVLAGGQYNMIPLAWLPLVLLWLEQAIEKASRGKIVGAVLRATWSGVVFSFFILAAYPYVTLYAGFFVALWSLTPALEQAGYLANDGPRTLRRTLSALARWASLGAWTALVAVAVGAIQLLPAIELATLATRSGGLVHASELGEGYWSLLFLVGSSYLAVPQNWAWEIRGGFGLLWLGLAGVAPLFGPGRVRFQAALGGLFLLLACGLVTAFYWLPGFGLFQLPSRLFLLAALPVALLAGVTTQTWLAAPSGRRKPAPLLAILVVLLLFAGMGANLAWKSDNLAPFSFRAYGYWLSAVVTVPAFLFLLSTDQIRLRPFKPWFCAAILLIDVWALTAPWIEVRPESAIYPESVSLSFLAEPERHGLGRVLDYYVSDHERNPNSPLGAGAPLALIKGLESLRGFNPIDVRRYKEYLQFIADDDEPLVPLQSPFTKPLLHRFPLKNRQLFDRLYVRWLLQPSAWPSGSWVRREEDPDAQAYDFITGGVRPLPPYTVYENRDPHLFRAYVVRNALPMPERPYVLAALKQANLLQEVLLEGFQPEANAKAVSEEIVEAQIKEYRPNRVVIRTPEMPERCYLVLADVWYPGWQCTVDGAPAKIYPANYLFRGVVLEKGAHDVVFTFAPDSYAWGRTISGWAVLLIGGGTLLAGGWLLKQHSRHPKVVGEQPDEPHLNAQGQGVERHQSI
jgi:hypothetical protein